MKDAEKSLEFIKAVAERHNPIMRAASLYAHLNLLKGIFGETFENALVEFLRHGGDNDVKNQP